MSMDDVYIKAQELAIGLGEFNDNLRVQMVEIDRSHAHVSPLWNDTMRQDYDRIWLPLQDEMVRYNQQVGPQYVAFLIDRLRHLKSYLHGT